MNGSRAWMERDFYKVLGVAEDATQDDIKRAYRKLAQKLHPDRNPGDKQAEERMKDIAEAYDVLSDPKKRAEYDQVRRAGRSGPGIGFGTGGGGGPFPPGVNVEDLGDLLGGMFGGRRRARARRGDDLETTVRLSFEDALRGATVPVRVGRDAACSACGGSGDRSGRTGECTMCGGSGTVGEGQVGFSFMRTCPGCAGRGRVVSDPCTACRGAGVERRADEVKVKIPAGINDGARIRVRGRGAAVPGGTPGDLYVVVSVEKHPLFARHGSDLHITVPVSFAEAALGSRVDVPTPDGAVTLKVPPGTQPGKVFRVRGRGVPKAKGAPGDLLVTVQVHVPEKLSSEERELIEKLASLNGARRAPAEEVR